MKARFAGAFLAALGLVGGALAAPTPCDRLTAYARKLPDSAWASGDKALAPAVNFHTLRSAEPRSTEASPFEKTLAKLPKVRSATDADEYNNVSVDHLDGTDLYAFSTVQGTLHCQTTAFLRVQPGGPVRLVHGPSSGDDDPCWTTSGAFARAFGQPVYVVHDGLFPTAVTASLTMTPWAGARWAAACRVTLKFRADYALTERHCGDAATCAAAGHIARAVALAYNRAREGGGDGAGFTYGPSRAGHAEAVKSFLAAQDSPSTWTPDFPAFGREPADEHPISYGGFALFPLTLEGRDLVGAIGHEGVGWREGAETLFAVYILKDGSLTPLAGFVFERSLAGLTSATVGPATAAR